MELHFITRLKRKNMVLLPFLQCETNFHTIQKNKFESFFLFFTGWAVEEVTILKKELQKFGIGKWKKIMQ